MKNSSLENLDPGVSNALLPEPAFCQIGEVDVEGPHFEDVEFRSSIRSARVSIRGSGIPESDSEFVARRRVVQARDGASVLPYFQLDGRWKVVMVEQFRVALGKATLEAAGGVVENQNPLETMAKELEEEAGLKISPDPIELRFRENLLPSLLNVSAWGGIVEIDPGAYENLEAATLIRERKHGRDSCTVRRVYLLDEI